MSDGDDDQMRLLQRLREDASPFDECAEDGGQTGAIKEDGMNIWQTAISIGGYLAGFAFLAIEVFVVSAGWSGFIIFGVLYLMLAITTILLGRCWNFVRQKWGTERHPYGAIGYEAFGDIARSFINFLVASISLCGSISLQLAFAETALIIGGPAVRGSFCIWPVVYGVFMCPFMWLGTPKDFWWISASSYFTVVLSIPLIIFSLVTQGGLSPSEVTHQHAHEEGPARESAMFHVAEMAGLLLWTRGFHYSFPTVQQDMKQPQSFTKAALLTDMLVLPLVLPMLLILFIIYGDTLAAITGDVTVLNLLHEDALKRVAGSLIMVHIVGACVLSNNPLFQYLEEVLGVPTSKNPCQQIISAKLFPNMNI